MLSADGELLGRLLFLACAKSGGWIDRPMRGMRDYIVRVLLRTLASDVPQIVHKIDFGKLAGDDEVKIHALCDAVNDFVILETERIPGDDEWNEGLVADKNVLKQGEVRGFVRAAVNLGSARVPLAGDSRRRKGGGRRRCHDNGNGQQRRRRL